MLDRLIQLVYLMAPAYVANMTPPFVRFWRGWNRPIHERWFGSHKTVVGAAAGIALALATAAVQSMIAWEGSLVPSDRWLLVGSLLGCGAMGGDVVKSWFKRRLRIPPGGRWVPFDQLDFVIGALLLIWPLASIGLADAAVILAVSFVGDLAVNRVAFWLGIRSAPW
jgi:CDP-2,3-bis-(O-geranylgeranyl)-sn-glycerol synthase